MLWIRWLVLLLLVSACVLFGLFALTSDPRYRRLGLTMLLWTLGAGFVFFGGLIAINLLE